MKISWVKYLVYLLIIALFIGLGDYFLRYIQDISQKTAYLNVFLLTFTMIIFYGGFGVILGLDGLLNEKNKDGIWKVRIPKMIILGIPSLYISLSYIIYYSSIIVIQYLARPLQLILLRNSKIVILTQILLGYVVITSFFKEKSDEKASMV